jgi:predicted permease
MAYDLRFALRMIRCPWLVLARRRRHPRARHRPQHHGLHHHQRGALQACACSWRSPPRRCHIPHSRQRRRCACPYPDLLDYRSQARSFAALEGASDQEGVLGEPGNPPQAYHLERATTGVFSMLHIHPVLGRDFLPSDALPGAAPVLMIGYAVWQNRYAGAPSVIGRQVRINETPATIIGVMPRGFMFPTTVDLWMPLAPTPNDLKRDNRQLQVFGLLQPGIRIAAAQAELTGIAHRLAAQYSATDKDTTALVMSFHERYNGGNIKMVFLLMLASVGFVLLIACANVANMMLSRAVARQREMSIRAALGASRWRVIRQLLIESVLLSVLGGSFGLGLAVFGVHWFDLATSSVGRPYWVQFTMDYSVFGYFAALCILSGLLFGMLPALRSSRPDLNQVLQEGARSVGHRRGGKLAAVLVVFQFALTLVLLTGAGVFVHSLLKTLDSNQSVPARQLMVARFQLPQDRYKDIAARQRFYDQLLPRLRALPGVTRAALTSNPPGLGSAESPIEVEHARIDDPAHRPVVAYVTASPGYFSTIRLPLLFGRDFNALDGAASHQAAILTRATAERFWPGQSALGKRFRLFDDQGKPGDWITVVGVTANLAQDLTERDPKPLLFVPIQQQDWSGTSLVVESTANPIAAGARRGPEPRSGFAPARRLHPQRSGRAPDLVPSPLQQNLYGIRLGRPRHGRRRHLCGARAGHQPPHPGDRRPHRPGRQPAQYHAARHAPRTLADRRRPRARTRCGLSRRAPHGQPAHWRLAHRSRRLPCCRRAARARWSRRLLAARPARRCPRPRPSYSL